jgi:hypothetical protein
MDARTEVAVSIRAVTSRKCGTLSRKRDELAVEDAAEGVSRQLRDQRRHVPAASAASTQAVLCRDGAEAVPLHLKDVITDGESWLSASEDWCRQYK